MAFDELLAEKIRCQLLINHLAFEEKKMFGGLCFLVKGKMLCGILKNKLIFRLLPNRIEDLLKDNQISEMDFTGRPLKGLLYASENYIHDEKKLQFCIEESLAFLATQPIKSTSMEKKDKRVDTYIEKAQDFAKPILKHLRKLVHQACPECTETIKWSFPNFEYKGILCSMAAFKEHCSFTFWNAEAIDDKKKILSTVGKTAMGHLGKITSKKDLPADAIIIDYIQQLVKMKDKGIKPKKKITSTSAEKKELLIPEQFAKALNKNKSALKTFNALSPSHKKEYVEWVNEAKREETKMKRIATSIEYLSDNKSLNWKYERKK